MSHQPENRNDRRNRKLIEMALREDVGMRDLTTDLTVAPTSVCSVRLVAKQAGILSGICLFRTIFDHVSANIRNWEALEDGTSFESGQTVATFQGLTAPILTGERTALNYVQHLSGVATVTRAYVDAAREYAVRICDTRKTTPLMRSLEKDAVRHGGGYNHRLGLHDGILIKENHIRAAGGIASAIAKASESSHHLMNIEVEVTNLAECDEAIRAGARVIMLDNMSLVDMKAAVESAKDRGIIFEASGNVTIERVADIAATGVDVISVGTLTHSAPAVDLSLQIDIES